GTSLPTGPARLGAAHPRVACTSCVSAETPPPAVPGRRRLGSSPGLIPTPTASTATAACCSVLGTESSLLLPLRRGPDDHTSLSPPRALPTPRRHWQGAGPHRPPDRKGARHRAPHCARLFHQGGASGRRARSDYSD